MMKFQRVFIIAFLLLTSMVSAQRSEAQVKTISKSELKAVVEKGGAQLLDVRRPHEFKKGHIKGAENLNILDSKEFTRTTLKLDKQKPVYVYCQAGKRSQRAAKKLKELGFVSIFDYADGYGSWASTD